MSLTKYFHSLPSMRGNIYTWVTIVQLAQSRQAVASLLTNFTTHFQAFQSHNDYFWLNISS